MKKIKEITEMAEKIEALAEVSEVAITEERLIITQVDNPDDVIFFKISEKLQKKVIELTGIIPTPCDVNYRDWFVYF